MARSNWVTCTFEWGKLLQSHFMEEHLQQKDYTDCQIKTLLTETLLWSTIRSTNQRTNGPVNANLISEQIISTKPGNKRHRNF